MILNQKATFQKLIIRSINQYKNEKPKKKKIETAVTSRGGLMAPLISLIII